MHGKRTVSIDGLEIGGNNPVRVESMLKTPLSDLNACLKETEELLISGCELVRVAFPDLSLADNLKKIVELSRLKIMADIHFNSILAVKALELGCRSIRINPGNMSNSIRIKEIIELAKCTNSVIRIGANAGSLSNKQIRDARGNKSVALFNAVEEQLTLLHEYNFSDIILSAKSSDVLDTVRANMLLSQKYAYPIHIGITEAGEGHSGIIKSAVGIGILLSQGIGDTIRVSLTEHPVKEVESAYHILRSLQIRKRGYNFISCPTCGRKRIDVKKLTQLVQENLPKNLPDGTTIAIMGCEVNGPREASEADIGIAGTPEGFLLFKKGQHICTETIDKLPEILKKIISAI